MADLLVRLYDLPDIGRRLPDGVTVRRGLPLERDLVVDWVARTFFANWASECVLAFSGLPIAAWIAVRDRRPVGFACIDATAKGFFGPTGVAEAERGRGIGEALLMAALRGMREAGYAYAVIGDPGPMEFYRKRLDVLEIPGSKPGIYGDMLRRD
jgi:GNAT superfamily N-acetyltransferase